jgi:gas vesicle protein
MVRRLLSLVIGMGLGAAVGVAIVMLFAPTTGDQWVKELKRGWSETMEEARKASEQRRRELEAELARMRGDIRQGVPQK